MNRHATTFACAALVASALLPRADAAGAPPPTPLQYFGLHIHRADAGTPWPPFRFGTWRLWDANVGWSSLQPERGKWFFGRLDRLVDLAQQRGVEPVLTLALTPTWASARPDEKSGYRPGNAAEPRDMEDWRTYVRTVAERYRGRIRHYEVWNEPSDTTFYTGSVETLVELAREAYRILKEVDPANQVISPPPAGGGRHLVHLDEYLAKGGKDALDIVGYHFYVWKTPPETMVPLIRDVKKIMQKHGIGAKPLWNTETGFWIENGDGTPENPAMVKGWRRLALRGESEAWLARSFIVARSEGIDRFMWYSWDNPHGFGMLEPTSGTPKPLAAAYQRVVEWMVDSTVESCDTQSGVWICPLQRVGASYGWIVWREGVGVAPWTVPTLWRVRVIRTLANGGGGVVPGSTFDVGQSPVLLLR